MRLVSESETYSVPDSWRLRLRFFDAAKWRLPAWARLSLPLAVNLNRLATAFFVFAVLFFCIIFL